MNTNNRNMRDDTILEQVKNNAAAFITIMVCGGLFSLAVKIVLALIG